MNPWMLVLESMDVGFGFFFHRLCPASLWRGQMNETLGYEIGERPCLSQATNWGDDAPQRTSTGCLESVLTPTLFLSLPWPTLISYQQQPSNQNRRLHLSLAGPASPMHHQTSLLKEAASSGIGDVGKYTGHWAGEILDCFWEGAMLPTSGTWSCRPGNALTMVQLDSLCLFEKRGGIEWPVWFQLWNVDKLEWHGSQHILWEQRTFEQDSHWVGVGWGWWGSFLLQIHRYWGERGAELLVLRVTELLFPCPWTPAPACYQVADYGLHGDLQDELWS